MSDTKIYEVSGYKPLKGTVKEYYRADTETKVTRALKLETVEQGGFVTYSIREIDVLPEAVFITCPGCDSRFASPDRVRTLN